MDKAYTRGQDAALRACTVHVRWKCSSPSSPMANRFSNLQGNVLLILNLHAKEIRKIDSCKQTQEVHPSATWTMSKNSWVRKFAVISFFFKPSLDPTQHHASMELARQQLVRISEWTTLQRAGYRLQLSFYCFRRCHCGWKKHWYSFSVVNQG